MANNFPSTASVLLGAGRKVVEDAFDAQSARQLNEFAVNASAARFDFFNALSQERDTSTYLSKLEEGLFAAYDEMADGLNNRMVKQKVTALLNTKKEQDRQSAIEMGQRNDQVFGSQEVETGLLDLISRGRDPGESYLGNETTPSYQTRVETAIGGRLIAAVGSKMLNADEASAMGRKYVQDFRNGLARELSYEAAGWMIDAGMESGDVLDNLEQVIRHQGTDPASIQVEGLDDNQRAQLQEMAMAWQNVILSPEDKEDLVDDVRSEVDKQAKRKIVLDEKEIEANTIKFAEIIYGPEWRMLRSNGHQAIKDMGGDDAGWVAKKIGEVEAKWKAEEHNTYLQEYNRDILKLDNKDDIDEMITRVGEDRYKGLTDEEADEMVRELNIMAGEIDDGDAGDVTKYRTSIFDLNGKLRAKDYEGLVTEYKTLAETILTDPVMIANDEKMERYVGMIESSLNKLASDATRAEREVNSGIGVFNLIVGAGKDQPIYDMIDTLTTPDPETGIAVMSPEKGIYWYGQVARRAETKNDQAVLFTHKAVTEGFQAIMRSTTIEDTAKLQVMDDYADALFKISQEADSEDYLKLDSIEKKEAYMASVRAQILEPLAEKGFFAGLEDLFSGKDTSYKRWQAAETEDPVMKRRVIADQQLSFSGAYSNTAFGVEFNTVEGAYSMRTDTVDGKRSLVATHKDSGVKFTMKSTGLFPTPVWYYLIPGESWERLADKTGKVEDVDEYIEAHSGR